MQFSKLLQHGDFHFLSQPRYCQHSLTIRTVRTAQETTITLTTCHKCFHDHCRHHKYPVNFLPAQYDTYSQHRSAHYGLSQHAYKTNGICDT